MRCDAARQDAGPLSVRLVCPVVVSEWMGKPDRRLRNRDEMLGLRVGRSVTCICPLSIRISDDQPRQCLAEKFNVIARNTYQGTVVA